ncbi:hypothetical protein BASA81_015401 [Batrachochytrium salamandrivorans]|nr:hypothetical protein BASA81_015401 [Batrachochytrium salamandrivorans]
MPGAWAFRRMWRADKNRTILDVVHASHRITVHALQFLKLYLLSCFENGVKLPLVTEHLVVSIMNVLCEESEHQETRGRSSGSPTRPSCYIAVDVVKDYENNLKLHFVQHLIRFLEFVYKKSEVMATGDKQARAKLFADLRAARDFVLFQPEASSKRVRLSGPVEAPVMPPRLADHMKHIVPQRRFQEGSVHYDIQCSPQDYLPCVHDAVGGGSWRARPQRVSAAQLHRPQVYQAGHHTRHPAPALKDLRVGREIQASQGYHRQQRCCLEERVPSGAEMFCTPGEQQVRVRPHHADRRDRVLAAVEREGRRRRRSGWRGNESSSRCPKTSSALDPNPARRGPSSPTRADQDGKNARGWGRNRGGLGDGVEHGLVAKALTVSAATAYFTKKNEVNARLFSTLRARGVPRLKWRAFVNTTAVGGSHG